MIEHQSDVPPPLRRDDDVVLNGHPVGEHVRDFLDVGGVVVAQVAQHVSTPRIAERDQHVVDVVGCHIVAFASFICLIALKREIMS